MALSPRDQSKWDSLQDKGGSAIDNILAGKGSDKDLKELSRILNEQHALAGQIFDQGVTDTETTASTIVDALNSKRIEEGKKPLTQKAFDRVFNHTFQQVMSQSIEDILGQIHDEFEKADGVIKDKIDKALEKIRNFTAAPTPEAAGPNQPAPQQQAQPEARSLFDRFMQQNGRAPESAEQKQSLMDRILRRSSQSDRAGDQQRTSVLQMIRDAAGTVKDKVTSLYDRFRNRGNDDEDKKANIWMRKLKAIFDPIKKAFGKVKKAGSKIGNILSMIGKPLLLALMNPQLIKSITDSVSQYLNFDVISKFVSDTWDQTKQIGSDSLNWIVDKVKSFFGFGEKKKPESKPAAPKVDPLKQNTASGSLPKSISASQAQSALPGYQTQLATAKQQLTQAQAAYTSNPSAANKKAVDDAQRNVSFFQTRVTQYQARAGETKTAGSSVDQASSFVSPPTTAAPSGASQGGDTATPPSGAASTGPSSAPVTTVNAPAPSGVLGRSSVAAPVTKVVSDSPTFEPGRSFTPREPTDDVANAMDKNAAATSQIGMGSFGFESNDSALNILNLGMIA